MRDECQHCDTLLIGDWLSTQDGEFCDHQCARIWELEKENKKLRCGIDEMLDFLGEVEPILDQYADADHDGDGPVPNAEMRGLVECKRLLSVHAEKTSQS